MNFGSSSNHRFRQPAEMPAKPTSESLEEEENAAIRIACILLPLFYVLRTGIIWNALPREKFEGVCSAMVHRKFQQWARAGVFQDIYRRGLAEYDALAGIAWHWQAADGSNIEAPLAQESIGPNPTDRGKKWQQTVCAGRREWRPFVTCRQRRQST